MLEATAPLLAALVGSELVISRRANSNNFGLHNVQASAKVYPSCNSASTAWARKLFWPRVACGQECGLVPPFCGRLNLEFRV